MNELMHTMHVMQEQNDACDARIIIFFFWVHGWSLQSSSLIKSWVQNRVSTPLLLTNHENLCANHKSRAR